METAAATFAPKSPKSAVVREGMRTPWGKAGIAKVIAAGIGLVGTPGHGGFKLAAKRNNLVNAAWRKAGGWYEEDCEAAIVILTFPECFDEDARSYAKSAAKTWFPDEYETVTGEKVAVEESHVLSERKFRAENVSNWVVTCAWGSWSKDVPEGMVKVAATLAGGRTMGVETKYFMVPAAEYDTRGHFGFVIDTSRHAEVAE